MVCRRCTTCTDPPCKVRPSDGHLTFGAVYLFLVAHSALDTWSLLGLSFFVAYCVGVCFAEVCFLCVLVSCSGASALGSTVKSWSVHKPTIISNDIASSFFISTVPVCCDGGWRRGSLSGMHFIPTHHSVQLEVCEERPIIIRVLILRVRRLRVVDW